MPWEFPHRLGEAVEMREPLPTLYYLLARGHATCLALLTRDTVVAGAGAVHSRSVSRGEELQQR